MLAGALALSSAPPPAFGVNDKAYYATEAQVNFVRPGLVFTITGVTVGSDGTVTASVKMTDPKGVALDRDGVTSPGPISARLAMARIPSGQKQYVSYTIRTRNSAITGTPVVQATADAGGVWTKVDEGVYDYQFGTKLPAGYDVDATHTIAVYGSRNLSEFDFPTSYDDATFDWVPSGAPVTTTRDVIKTATCNKCHDPLALHGGTRRTMEVCVLCHTPQTTDDRTNNTVDMIEMTHKIHMGANLPSVVAGGTYKLAGSDFSEVGFPPTPAAAMPATNRTPGPSRPRPI